LSPDRPLIPAARARELLGHFASRWPQWDRPGAQASFDGGSHAVEFWPMVGGAFSAVGRAPAGRHGTASIVSWARDRAWAWPFSVGAAGEALLVSPG
jgi:hypothetical protein